MLKLNVKSFGLALGIVWGGIIFLFGVMDMFYFWGNAWGKVMHLVYMPTLLGSLAGAILGFVYASLIGFAVAWLYNRFVEEEHYETNRRIKELARKIWEKKGRPSGTANEDWKEAERIIHGK